VMHLHPRRTFLAASALFACLAAGTPAQQGGAAPALAYDTQTHGLIVNSPI
jgi:hypothetical protein